MNVWKYLPEYVQRRKDAFLLLGLMVLVCLFLYPDYIFQKKLFIFMDAGADTFQGNWPLYSLFAHAVKHLDFSFWSFQMGMGTNTFTSSMLFFDAFNWPLYLMNEKYIPYALIYIGVMKIILAGLFFYWYLKIFNLSRAAAIITSILYAFCSYMVLWGQHYFFASIIVWAPLLLLALEYGIRQSKWMWFSLAVAYMSFSMFYFFYMLSIYLLVYLGIRSIWEYGFKLKPIARTCLNFSVFYILGLGLAAVFLLPNLQFMLSNPRVSPCLSAVKIWQLYDQHYWISFISRLFSDIGIYQSGWKGPALGNWEGSLYESPEIYCGILPLLLLPQLIKLPPGKQKSLVIGLAVAIAAFIAFHYFSYIFNGFSTITNRWMFVYVLGTLLITAFILDDVLRSGLDKQLLLCTAIICLLLYLAALYWGSYHFTLSEARMAEIKQHFKAVVIFTLIYSALLYSLNYYPKQITWVLMLMVCVEMVTFHYTVVNQRFTVNPKSGYVESLNRFLDQTRQMVTWLKGSDPDFYRIEKDYNFTWGPNDSYMLPDFKSTNAYLPLQQPAYLRFREEFAAIPENPRIEYNLPLERYLLKSLVGIRYYLSTARNAAPAGFSFLRSFGKDHEVPLLLSNDIPAGDFHGHKTENEVFVFKNENALPLGFGYDKYIPMAIFKTLTPREKDVAVIKAAVLDPGAKMPEKMGRLEVKDLQTPWAKDIMARREAAFEISRYSNGKIKGKINSLRDYWFCFTIPYDPGWRIIIDHKIAPVTITNVGFLGTYVPAGKHEVELRFFPACMKAGALMSLISLLGFIWIARKVLKLPSK